VGAYRPGTRTQKEGKPNTLLGSSNSRKKVEESWGRIIRRKKRGQFIGFPTKERIVRVRTEKNETKSLPLMEGRNPFFLFD